MKKDLLLLLCVVSGSALAASIFSYYTVGVLWLIAISVIMAVSVNLTVGVLGQFTLGHAGFMSVGAYTAALLSLGLSRCGLFADSRIGMLIVCLAAAGIVSGIFGLFIGIPALRLRGDYLSIITLGFGEIIRVAIQNLPFAGGNGLSEGTAGPILYKTGLGFTNPEKCLYLPFAAFIAAVTVWMVSNYISSQYGRRTRAISCDELAAAASGIDTTSQKILTFVISGVLAGVSGSLYACCYSTIDSESFGFAASVDYIVMVVAGGIGSVRGSVFGAAVLVILAQIFGRFSGYRELVYAITLILVMVFRPKGLFGGRIR